METKRRDRLARFGTLKDPKIEQPFKPIESAGKGDNTRPLWRDGLVNEGNWGKSPPPIFILAPRAGGCAASSGMFKCAGYKLGLLRVPPVSVSNIIS